MGPAPEIDGGRRRVLGQAVTPSEDGQDRLEVDGARREALLEVWRAGRAAWPALALEAEAFVAWAVERFGSEGPVERLRGPDVFLVAATLLGVAGAARALVEGPLARSEAAALRILPDASARAEVMQELAVHLLTPGGDASGPRLRQYDGRVPLRAWLRIAVARRALNHTRAERAARRLAGVLDCDGGEHDPERSAMRRLHREEVGACLREAIAQIAPEDAALLRLHYAHGSTLAELAALHRTSKSAMHRQLDLARRALWQRMSAFVGQRLRLEASQRDSALWIFRGELVDALAALLAPR